MADAHSEVHSGAHASGHDRGRGDGPQRPLSPHLQIHRLHINMLMSILHRLTGAALYFGTTLLAVWLIAAATSAEGFIYVASWFATWPGQFVLLGYTWALFHHMLGGVRHLIWDTGRGYELATIDLLSWGSILLSLTMTLAVWFAVAQGIL